MKRSPTKCICLLTITHCQCVVWPGNNVWHYWRKQSHGVMVCSRTVYKFCWQWRCVHIIHVDVSNIRHIDALSLVGTTKTTIKWISAWPVRYTNCLLVTIFS